MSYCHSSYSYSKRKTREVTVGDLRNGGIIIGGNHPIVNQSMLTSDTLDTETCVKESLDLAKVGCQIIRITAQTVRHARNLENIVAELRNRRCLVPVVADIHFKPDAALEAARWVEKIRINPGNYADSKKFQVKEYSDQEYSDELSRIETKFTPLIKICKELNRAMRIGTNHGSLSDRIMNRFGDTPLGMVESALEFARIARKNDYHNFVFSMKSSNPKVMIECYRLLVNRLNELGEDWNYPVHLGVTEAGEGEDGRIKSAIGIGSLLCDGIGDTIRVSLTEDAAREIPVCNSLLGQISKLTETQPDWDSLPVSFDPFCYERRQSNELKISKNLECGKTHPIRVIVTRAQALDLAESKRSFSADTQPEGIYEDLNILELDPRLPITEKDITNRIVTIPDELSMPLIPAFRMLSLRLDTKGLTNPILLKDSTQNSVLDSDQSLLRASVILGSLIADGIGDAVLIRGEVDAGDSMMLAYNILQASGSRSFKTDYVACPSCGRTLFNLQTVTARIKHQTDHLKGVKIAVMGCIVNGPGEMADADFGYVGGAPGKINLYVGKIPVRFNIPEDEAVDSLVDLIKEQGRWENQDSENPITTAIRL